MCDSKVLIESKDRRRSCARKKKALKASRRRREEVAGAMQQSCDMQLSLGVNTNRKLDELASAVNRLSDLLV